MDEEKYLLAGLITGGLSCDTCPFKGLALPGQCDECPNRPEEDDEE